MNTESSSSKGDSTPSAATPPSSSTNINDTTIEDTDKATYKIDKETTTAILRNNTGDEALERYKRSLVPSGKLINYP